MIPSDQIIFKKDQILRLRGPEEFPFDLKFVVYKNTYNTPKEQTTKLTPLCVYPPVPQGKLKKIYLEHWCDSGFSLRFDPEYSFGDYYYMDVTVDVAYDSGSLEPIFDYVDVLVSRERSKSSQMDVDEQ